MTKELKLNKQIMAHAEKLSVLELREPTYDEIASIGFPFTFDASGAIKPDSKVSLAYLPLLAGIPKSSAEQMDKLDIFKASMMILGFFTPSGTGETSDGDSTTSPGSGS